MVHSIGRDIQFNDTDEILFALLFNRSPSSPHRHCCEFIVGWHWIATAVVILCFLCTITTRFEYELKSSEAYFDASLGKPCTAAEVSTNAYANACKLVSVIVIQILLVRYVPMFRLLGLLNVTMPVDAANLKKQPVSAAHQIRKNSCFSA